MWAISEEVMADCNEFVKVDQHGLEQSSLIKSEPAKGVIVWDTPYAKRQYWEIKTAHKDVNPNATWRWCEAAKKKYKEKWQKSAQKAFKMFFK